MVSYALTGKDLERYSLIGRRHGTYEPEGKPWRSDQANDTARWLGSHQRNARRNEERLAQEEVPQLGTLQAMHSMSANGSQVTPKALSLTQLKARNPIVMIDVPAIITLRGPSRSITVPPTVAPANVMQDDTDPIHAVTDLAEDMSVSTRDQRQQKRGGLQGVLR